MDRHRPAITSGARCGGGPAGVAEAADARPAVLAVETGRPYRDGRPACLAHAPLGAPVAQVMTRVSPASAAAPHRHRCPASRCRSSAGSRSWDTPGWALDTPKPG